MPPSSRPYSSSPVLAPRDSEGHESAEAEEAKGQPRGLIQQEKRAKKQAAGEDVGEQPAEHLARDRQERDGDDDHTANVKMRVILCARP